MNLLGIDTSGEYSHIVLSKGDITKSIRFKRQFNRYPESSFLLRIKELLKNNRLSLTDLDAFIIGRGPGSFTGLRVGFATLFGLNFVMQIPVVGLSSLDFIAWNAKKTDFDNICVIQDARRGLVYACIYKLEDGFLRRSCRYLLIKPDDFVKMVKKNSCILGDGLKCYKHIFNSFTCLDEGYWQIKSVSIIELAKLSIKERSLSNFRNKVLPLYLYDKECQIKK